MLFMFSLVAYVRWFMESCIVSCIMASMVFKFAFGDWFKGWRPSFRVKYSFRMATGLTGLGYRSDRLLYIEPMQSHADRSDRSVAPV